MHLSVAIPGGGGEGGDPGEPPGHLYSTATFTKPRLFNKNLLTPLPWEQRSVFRQVERRNISKELYLP